MGPVSFKTRQQEFWADLDGFQRSGDWEESDQEAESYDAEVEKEIKRKESGAREITEVSAVQDASQSERDSAIAGKAPNPSAEMMEFTSTSTSNVLPSFHRSDIAQTSTPRHKHASDMLDIPIPSFSTPALRRPLKHAASKLSIPPATANTPDNIPSPIDTPDSSRITRSIVEGRGRRDGPATPIPLGTAAFSKLRGKKDFQTLTKHFEAFTKTVAKEAVVSIVKGKGKGRTMEKAMSTSGLGGKVFDGLRFCIPPELGQVTKHKQRWDIISKLGGQVTLQPDTAITHVIYDSGRSASVLTRELGLQTLSELPEGTVCVRWDWVVQCKMAGKVLETISWLTFPKTAFTRVASTVARVPTRMADITDLLKGRGISISRKREHTASDSDTESPKRPRQNATTRTVPIMLPRRTHIGPSRLQPTTATSHVLPSGPGWRDGMDGERDGLDEMISGLKNGSIQDGEQVAESESASGASGLGRKGGDDDEEHSNPDAAADNFRCGQSHDGTAAKGPNQWLAVKFDEMHEMYQAVPGKSHFAIRQYQQAASAMRRTPYPITGGAEALKVKGIGQGIADRIDEFISGGHGRHYYENTEQIRAVQVFRNVYGVGTAFANELYRRGARTIEDLRTMKYGLTPGQLIGVDLYDDLNARISREECKRIFEIVRDEAQKIDSKLWIEIMGSYRRGQETSGDVDFLITRDTADGLTHAGVLPQLVHALKLRGAITHDLGSPHDWKAEEAKWMGVGKVSPAGKYRRIDILCIPFDQWGGALIYFTGNEIFNRSLRLYARKKGYSLNQRGLSRDVIRGKDGLKQTEGEIIASRTEEEIFNVLGIRWRTLPVGFGQSPAGAELSAGSYDQEIMPTSTPHLQVLIAHYLASNYPAVLEPFLQAAQIPTPDVTSPPQPELRTLVQDYLSHRFAEDTGTLTLEDGEIAPADDGSWRNWKSGDMMKVEMHPDERLVEVRRTLEGISASNLLTVDVRRVPRREFDTATAAYRASYPLSIVTTSVDKNIYVLDYETGEPHRAAVLAFAFHPFNPRYLLTGSMDGTTVLTDLITSTPLQTLQSAKFVVRVAFSPDGKFMVTASYDHNIVIYSSTSSATPPEPGEDDIPLDETDDPSLACDPELRYAEVKRIKVDSNPEAILFHPSSTWLLYTVRSSHLLYYMRLDTWETQTKSFNPHPMDTHVSFSILNMALHPSGRILACQTGDHRGGAGERVLLYGVEPKETDRLGCLWTGSEGDDFVLPRMAWLPDGSGLITTPNGYLNLIAITGETRSSVKIHGASELGQSSSEVVRDCCVVSEDGQWEVVSVGYDRRVRISR